MLLLVTAAGVTALTASPAGTVRPSQYKELSQLLEVMGTRVLAEASSPLGFVSVVDSPRVPFRYAPGLSLSAPREPPPQLALFTDGEGMSVLNRFDGRREPLEYLAYLTSALPYQLVDRRACWSRRRREVDVLQALYHGAASVDAVELNPGRRAGAGAIRRLQRRYGAWRACTWRGARFAEAGDTLRSDQLRLIDAFSASAAGLYALSESYIYTVEALESYARRSRRAHVDRSRWSTCRRATR
jgi:hypothetical protein